MLAEEQTQNALILDPVFGEIRSYVVNATGNVRLSQNASFLMEKISRRLRLHGLSSLRPYLALLKHDIDGKAELDHLISELTIGETSFFRHREQFDALRDKILPELLKRNSVSKRLRIWSAGCSNGAEAFSISIVLSTLLDTALKDWDVTIVGSDINRAFLAEAERGSYSQWILRNIPNEQLPQYFERDGHAWSIRERYKRKVKFIWGNLLSDHGSANAGRYGPFDIVFCRNVMIYFDSDSNQYLTRALAGTLVENGLLFVAPADVHQHLAASFVSENQISPGIFRKRGEAVIQAVVPLRASQAPGVNWTAAGAANSRAGNVVPMPDNGRRHVDVYRKKIRVPAAEPPRLAETGKANEPGPALQLETIIDSANRGDWTNAARQCEQMLATDRLNAPVHYYHGLVLQYAGNTREAERAWRRSIYLDQDFALAHYQLGLSRKEAGDLKGAIKAFRNAIIALDGRPEEHPVDPFDKVTVDDLRELSARQLGPLEKS